MSIRNKTFAVVAGVAVFAIVSASAATLGGITVDDLGAENSDVNGQLDNGVTVEWTTEYNTTLEAYAVTEVSLTPTDSLESFPAGADVALTLIIDGGSPVEVLGTGSNIAVSPAVAAEDVIGVAVVVNGGSVTTN